MADTASAISQLAKEIESFEIKNTEDVRILADKCRAFQVCCADVMSYGEFELYAALSYIDRGRRRRAKQVTRPLKHAIALNYHAAKRCAAVWVTFRKAFAEELSAGQNRQGQRRQFDWNK